MKKQSKSKIKNPTNKKSVDNIKTIINNQNEVTTALCNLVKALDTKGDGNEGSHRDIEGDAKK